MNPLEKHCTKCRQKKPLDSFCKHPRGQFGRAAQCKGCDKDYRAIPEVAVRMKARHKKRRRARHNSPQYSRNYAAAERISLKDNYVLGLIKKRYGLDRSVIRNHPTLLDAYKRVLIARRIGYRFERYPVLLADKKAKKMLQKIKERLLRKLKKYPDNKRVDMWRSRLTLLQSHPWFAFKPNGRPKPDN